MPKRPGLAFASGDGGDSKRARVIVSWNELQRTCQKAFRGLEIPAGSDEESSFAVLWLQARGLDALTPLGAALSALDRSPPRPLGVAGDTDGLHVLHAEGQPSVSVASDAIDLAMARAVETAARADVLLTEVENAIFVAGALAQRPGCGRCGRVEWRDGKVRRRLDMAPGGESRLSTAPPDDSKPGGGLGQKTVRITIGEISGPGEHRWLRRDRSWCTDADEAELERRAVHSVTHGIDVPDALWTRLLGFAGSTLVPTTRASRERGAGGGEYDD